MNEAFFFSNVCYGNQKTNISLVIIATVAKGKIFLIHFKELSATNILAKFQLLRINLS